MAEERMIIAGFGGQGALAIGQILAFSGMLEGKNVSWVPSYGPEMRGGTANCSVTISDDPVGSPIVTEATTAIVLNLPSFTKFESYVVPGGNLFINADLVNVKSTRDDINVYYINCDTEAAKVGNPKASNMIMLGALLEKTNIVKKESIYDHAFLAVFHEEKSKWFKSNEEAVERGMEIEREQRAKM